MWIFSSSSSLFGPFSYASWVSSSCSSHFCFSSAYVASPVPPVPASVLLLVLVGSSISALALPSADVGSFVQGLLCLYVCMSVCNELTIEMYGFTHSLRTFLACATHDAITCNGGQGLGG